uniref:RING-type E3 ubiquitin transferase n=1 Tax=Sarcophilus harrisii TaxID=9305 RepID=A0A7N4Q246_SARHA
MPQCFYQRITKHIFFFSGWGISCKIFTKLDICKIWCSKPLHVLRDYCDVIKIYIFWPLLFQREQTPVVSQLHPCIDVSSSSTCELSLKRLQHIELLEDIVDLAKKVVVSGTLMIHCKDKILAIEEAFNWVKYTGEFRVLRKLERAENCWPMLSIFFTEYKYHITKVVLEDCNLVEEFEYQNCAACIKEGEIMKTRGNEEFSEERFDTAITYYTRAIEFRPENHLLYSNRALCFLRTGQFNALGDGKRATILKYNWPKGHYRFCDALSMLGEHAWALEANERAQHLCRNYPDGMKDLTQQNIKLQKQVEELRDLQSLLDKQFSKSSRAVQQDFAILIKMLQSLIEEGCTALMDQHCRSAAKAFSRLLSDLDPNKLKQLNLALINYVLVIYGYAISLLGIGMPEELSEAEYQFKRIIEQYPNEGVDCLAYFGIGKVYLKKNRFSDALGHFQKSKTMIKLIPGVLTWPTTNVIIEESQLILENHIEECKFPPDPDAVCCYQKCNGYSKIQIYLNDPDFKGFIRINCCQFCRIEFHISCWKKLKTTIFNDKNDKDFLQGTCLTPDCRGIISKIVIFGAAGHIKCEVKKLKIKEEKKVKRKLQKKEAQKIAKERMEEKTRENNSSKHGDHKGFVQSCHLLDDRILLCIKQNAEQIKSGIQDASKLLRELLSWKVINTEDYADTYFNSGFLSEKMEHLIDHLVRKNNRVNTRIFLHVLSEIEEINPKLRDWIQKLNNLGLDATRTFFSRYGDSVKKLDFKFISMLWVEKYGHKLDHIISSYEERKIVEYSNNQGSLKEARYFIWLLEENREKFPALHNALDEFFDIMDSLNNLIFTKIYLFLYRLQSNSYDPFVVPEYLRDEVEEFEALYEKNSSNNCNYQKLLDSNLDPKCEPLYDYFSQILEEHGPLEIDDKLLVGEYEHFPEEARKIVEEAGGLKSFLLDSLRFIMIDNYIGLMKDAVQLKKNKTTGTDGEESTSLDEKDSMIFSPRFQKNASQLKLQLNPAAKEFKPVTCNSFIPAPKNKKTNKTAKYVTTGYVSYIPFNTVFSNQGFDTSNTSVSYANMLPQSSQCISLYTTVSDISSDYPKKRKLPLVSAVPPMTDNDKRDNFDSGNSEACNVKSERPMLEKVCSSGKPNCEKKIRQNTQRTTLKAEICKNNTAKDACLGSNDHCDLGTSKLEREMKNTTIIKNTPCIRMVAIQVSHYIRKVSITHIEHVNTLPFGPFETQQGDILRMEKEHQVLQEQLKEAREKYEQLKCRSTEETREVEEKLKRTIEENKISKTELNWFHQDLEIEVKKWQQEKKENQEKLKTLRNKVKKLNDTHEIYSRNNEEKDQQYASHLDEFLKISNKFANEKLKMEELIKKGKENYEETMKRAVAAEVSLLLLVFSWHVEIDEVNTFQKCMTVVALFNNRMTQVSYHYSPADINDPASVTYSAQVHSDLFSEYDDQSPVIIPADLLTGSQALTLQNTNLHSGSDCSEEITSVLLQASYTDPCQVTQPSPIVKSSEKDTQINQSSKGVSQTHASTPNQPPFNNVIEHLSTIFPNYSSVELLNFIQKVQNQDRTTHASLESDEIVRRVTELILDEQNKKLVSISNRCSEWSLFYSHQFLTKNACWLFFNVLMPFLPQVSSDDPCIICYEELNQEHVCEMDCGHQFHKWV